MKYAITNKPFLFDEISLETPSTEPTIPLSQLSDPDFFDEVSEALDAVGLYDNNDEPQELNIAKQVEAAERGRFES